MEGYKDWLEPAYVVFFVLVLFFVLCVGLAYHYWNPWGKLVRHNHVSDTEPQSKPSAPPNYVPNSKQTGVYKRHGPSQMNKTEVDSNIQNDTSEKEKCAGRKCNGKRFSHSSSVSIPRLKADQSQPDGVTQSPWLKIHTEDERNVEAKGLSEKSDQQETHKKLDKPNGSQQKKGISNIKVETKVKSTHSPPQRLMQSVKTDKVYKASQHDTPLVLPLVDDDKEKQSTWYQKSIECGYAGTKQETFIAKKQLQQFENPNSKKYYEKMMTLEEMKNKLEVEKDKYKRCSLKIRTTHNANAKILDKEESDKSDIIIEGRSKINRTCNDDEVVVELISAHKPQGKQGTSHKQRYGKVVGVLKRNAFSSRHPIMFCTVNTNEYCLMKPLCNTVPKVFIMREDVKTKFGRTDRSHVGIYSISATGFLEIKGFFPLVPEETDRYVFKVVYLTWNFSGSRYPLGAVLDVFNTGANIIGGLELLSLQHRVPTLYPRDVCRQVQNLLDEPILRDRREYLTNKCIFTIDKPNSKDLDDAISLENDGANVVIGVHIADVASVIKPNTPIDIEAKCRAVTFYPAGCQPHHMIPEPLSEGKCSLLPGQERLAISLFYKFDEENNRVGDVAIQQTIIKSHYQLTFADVQRVLDKEKSTSIAVDKTLITKIQRIHEITSQLKNNRRKLSRLCTPYEDPRLSESSEICDHPDAHSMIEELMILTNTNVAQRLIQRFPEIMLLRCQQEPSSEESSDYLKQEGYAAHLVMQLQDKHVPPDTTISFQNMHFDPNNNTQNVYIQNDLWERLSNSIKQKNYKDAKLIAFMDKAHPLQCLALSHWQETMHSAEYKCSHGLNRPDLNHYDLSKEVYTNFTSPIRRYADLHVQRLLHADLDHPDSRPPNYCSTYDVKQLAQDLTTLCKREKSFEKACSALKLASDLHKQPLKFRAVVDHFDEEQLNLCLPSLFQNSSQKQKVSFSSMGIADIPNVTNIKTPHESEVTVRLMRKVFPTEVSCYTPLAPVFCSSITEQNNASEKGKQPDLKINRDFHTISLPAREWSYFLTSILQERCSLEEILSFHATLSKGLNEVQDMSSEQGTNVSNGSVTKVCVRPIMYETTFKKGQIFSVQMSADAKRGLLEPKIDLLEISRNYSICTQHLGEPVKTLTKAATISARQQPMKNFADYLKTWMPLVEMEAAVGASNVGGSAAILDVQVRMLSETNGCFCLNTAFCVERRINVGGKDPYSFKSEESSSKSDYSLDYLCLRFRMACPATVISRIERSKVPEILDKDFTWLAHASVTRVYNTAALETNQENVQPQMKSKSQFKSDGNTRATADYPNNNELTVEFTLSHTSPKVPNQIMNKKDGVKMTVEILSKSEVERRAQELLLKLDECELARAIAYESNLPALPKDMIQLGEQAMNRSEKLNMPLDNESQRKAIGKALTNSLTLIQGPPGTGKTDTGIKLIYKFSKINQQLQKDGRGHWVTLFCGPSNKSVDLVAKELSGKLGENNCPKFLRVYSDTIKTKDFPDPQGDVRHTRGRQNLGSDAALLNQTLHNIIRDCDKPLGKEILKYEKSFTRNAKNVSEETLRAYRKLVFEASVAEIRDHDLVMTTCAVAGNRMIKAGLEGRSVRVIIDECGMCTEPHSMIPIIANNAQQVVLIGDHKQLRPVIMCQQAVDLGLDQSLFERLVTKFPQTVQFLDTQYRMHPEICEFPSKEFYKGQLKTAVSRKWQPVQEIWSKSASGNPKRNLVVRPLPFWPPLPAGRQPRAVLGAEADCHVLNHVPIVMVDVRGEETSLTVATDEGSENSCSNPTEVDKVIDILKYLKRMHKDIDQEMKRKCGENVSDDVVCDVALLTQYQAQRNLLEKNVNQLCGKDQGSGVFTRYDKDHIKKLTVVSSQGGEWDYVILSLVRSLPSFKIEPNPTEGWCRQNLGFIIDRNQANVALTRAKRGLIIVGNMELLQCDETWRRLVKRSRELGCLFQTSDFPPRPSHQRHTKHNASNSNWTVVRGRKTASWGPLDALSAGSLDEGESTAPDGSVCD